MNRLIALLLLVAPLTAPAEAKFVDAKHGISFRYPHKYVLKQGALEGTDDVGLGYLGAIPMEFVAPGGGMRIATVEAPGGSYPGTDFVNAFFTLSVNQFVTEQECAEFLDDRGYPETLLTKTVSGVIFRGADVSGAAMGHQSSAEYYHAYSDGACIELGYGLATAGYGNVEGLKRAPTQAILARFAKILSSVRIRRSLTRRDDSPSILSFDAAPLPAAGSYRLSWDVAGAAPDDLALLIDCLSDVSIETQAGNSLDGAPFPCDVVHPLGQLRGSLDISFENGAGQNESESIRLFVAGRPAASSTLVVSLYPSPRIFAITSYWQMQPVILSGPSQSIPIGAGLPVKIHGIAFDGTETVSIGAARIAVESVDGRTLSFTAPTSLPAGEYDVTVSNDRGSSNAAHIRLDRPHPQFALCRCKPKIVCEGGDAIIPGHEVRVEGIGILPANTVWIGSTSVTATSPGGRVGRWYLYFTAPPDLAAGKYPMHFTNDLGKSETVDVTVTAQ